MCRRRERPLRRRPPVAPPGKDSADPTAAFVGGPVIRRVIARWGPVFFWMGLIFLLSSLSTVPRVPEEVLDTLLKKAAHIGEYAILGALLYRALRPEGSNPWNRSTVLSAVLAGIYGISDELHQALVPGRNPSPVDVGIDTVGGLAGSWALTLWHAARR